MALLGTRDRRDIALCLRGAQGHRPGGEEKGLDGGRHKGREGDLQGEGVPWTESRGLFITPCPPRSPAVDSLSTPSLPFLQVRNARAEYGVEEKRKVAATIVVQGNAALREALTAELQVGNNHADIFNKQVGDVKRKIKAGLYTGIYIYRKSSSSSPAYTAAPIA